MKERAKKKVVLADRDGFYLQKLKRSLERKGDMLVVGMTDDGPTALEMVQKFDADVLLLDILLGAKDGFWVLECLNKMESGCISIMISAIDSDKLVRRAINLGADYFMAKPIQGDLLLERIHQMLDHEIPTSRNVAESSILDEGTAAHTTNMQPEDWHHNLESEISILLSRMGISAGIKGYRFIRQAVLMAVEDEEMLAGITKGLYPDIAKAYHSSASKVERAIRHAIESAWKANGAQVYFEIVGCFRADKPTNGQFIAALTEYFRMRQRNSPKKIS